MAFNGASWDETTPTNADLVNEVDDNLRDIKSGVSGRLGLEHVFPTSQSATNQGGFHKYITFQAQTSTPGLVYGTSTQNGALFTDSNNSLVYENSAGSNTIIIPGSTATGGVMPAGAMIPYAGSNSPSGWVICTGGAISRTTFSRLFNAIGTTWGTGDNTTTFNVPDMRGFIPVGQSGAGIFASLAASTGALVHTLVASETPVLAVGINADNGGSTATNSFLGRTGSSLGVGSFNVNSTGGGSHNNVQPSKVVVYIIKD